MIGNIFSELWHRVDSLKLSIVYNATIDKQVYRGKTWYVFREPYNNKFFRVTPKAYQFLMRLTAKRSVGEIWEEYLEYNPDDAPTQDEVIRLLTQLHQSNLLYFKNMPNNEHIFKRHIKKQNVELRNKFVSFLYLKIPLWDPQQWLKSSTWLISLLINKFTLIIWFLTLLVAGKIFIDNYHDFFLQTEGLLSPSNMPLLYVSLFVLKLFHEMGHAMMSRKFGGDVHTLGIMFIVFTPLPYMDASTSWLFKNKWHRILVSSAGMIVELFFAAIATMVWVNTGDGIIHSIAFNVMIIGSISSLIFNGNPLLKFDSYYILSDYLEIPNLQKKAIDVWLYWWQKYIFKITSLKKAYDNGQEGVILATYGVLSYMYRFLVAISIALFISDQWFIVGILVVLLSVYIWVLKPLLTFVKYLYSDSMLVGKRKEVVFLSLFIFSLIVIPLGFIPVSSYIYADGVIQSKGHLNIFSKTDGYLVKINISDGEKVKRGDLLISFENEEIGIEVKNIEAKMDEANLLLLKSRNESIADIKNILRQLEVLKHNLEFLAYKRDNLKIYATQDGVWVSNNISNYIGSYLKIGVKMGEIIPIQNFDFIGVVSQEDSSDLFGNILKVELKLYSEVKTTIPISKLSIIPYETNELPSSALGWQGGGNIMTTQEDDTGLKTSEAFFKVVGILDEQKNPFLYNERGTLRIQVPDKTLIESGIESLKKLLQKRYKI